MLRDVLSAVTRASSAIDRGVLRVMNRRMSGEARPDVGRGRGFANSSLLVCKRQNLAHAANIRNEMLLMLLIVHMLPVLFILPMLLTAIVSFL